MSNPTLTLYNSEFEHIFDLRTEPGWWHSHPRSVLTCLVGISMPPACGFVWQKALQEGTNSLSTSGSEKKHIKHLYGQQIVMILLSGRIHKEKNCSFWVTGFFFFIELRITRSCPIGMWVCCCNIGNVRALLGRLSWESIYWGKGCLCPNEDLKSSQRAQPLQQETMVPGHGSWQGSQALFQWAVGS